MRPWAVIARREAAGIARERTIVLAIAIQVVVAGFSSFLLVGLAALVDPELAPIRGEPAVAVNASALPPELARELRDAGLRVASFASDEAAWRGFTLGQADAALLLAGDDPLHVTLGLPDGDLRAPVTLTKLKHALEAEERARRAEAGDRLSFEPVYVETQANGSAYEFVYALLVPLLVLLPVVLAGALCADSLTEEIQRGTLPLLLASPATPADVVAGKMLANLAVAPALALAWLLLLGLNGLPVPPAGVAGILALTTAGAFLTCVLGCAIALLVRDRNKAQTLYATLFFLLAGASFALPLSPTNAVALLAAGAPSPGLPLLVGLALGLAVAAWAALGLLLRRAGPRLAAGVA
jgi:ABC-type Na+ efflux pump permease subunit